MSLQRGISLQEQHQVIEYLHRVYADIFTDAAIEGHLEEYVGYSFAEQVLPFVRNVGVKGDRLLDIGCGFGSFVLKAREAGLDARGVEIAPFEIEIAQARCRALFPSSQAEVVFTCGDATAQALEPHSLNIITLWNVIEHIADWSGLLRSLDEALKPGGWVFIICPNYTAFRQEAHYHVPWMPFLPRWLASRYLKWQGRNPGYFERGIFYRSNWEVLCGLKRAGYEIHDISTQRPMGLSLKRLLRSPLSYGRFYNPFKHSVVLAARKGTQA